MTANMKNKVYMAFGLRMLSSIPLPELVQTFQKDEETERSEADVLIEEGDLSELWSELVCPERKSIVKADFYMFGIPNVAKFCIQNGDKIIVSPEKGADKAHMRMFILGTCMGALLMQRKILPLHGSALAIDGKAYGIIGDSGAGKSTLASVLMQRGYHLLTDDVIAVHISDNGNPMVLPSYPQQKLWQESLAALGMKTDEYSPIYMRETKYMVPVKTTFSPKSLPLAGVFELVKTEKQHVESRQVQGLERLHTLFRHTYRNLLISGLKLREWHFNTTAGIANKIEFFQLGRPASGFTASNLASILLTQVDKEAAS